MHRYFVAVLKLSFHVSVEYLSFDSILNNFLYFLLLTFSKLVTLGLLHFEGSYYFTSLCTNQMVGTIVHKRQSYWCESPRLIKHRD